MIAVLFFSLCSTVLLQAFAAAHRQSELSGVRTASLAEARDLVEQLDASDDAAAVLTANGCAMQDGVWTLEREGYTVAVTVTEEATGAGTLRGAEVAVRCTLPSVEPELFTLKSARYMAAEVE